MEKDAFKTIDLFHVSRLAKATFTIRQIAKIQMTLDHDFFKEVYGLQTKLYTKKINHKKFWNEYKKSLLKSLKGNNKLLKNIFTEIEKEVKKGEKKAKQQKQEPEKSKEPMIDLKLSE